jgi:hypothetical protein
LLISGTFCARSGVVAFGRQFAKILEKLQVRKQVQPHPYHLHMVGMESGGAAFNGNGSSGPPGLSMGSPAPAAAAADALASPLPPLPADLQVGGDGGIQHQPMAVLPDMLQQSPVAPFDQPLLQQQDDTSQLAAAGPVSRGEVELAPIAQ